MLLGSQLLWSEEQSLPFPVSRCLPGCYCHCFSATASTVAVLPRGTGGVKDKTKQKRAFSSIVLYISFPAPWTRKRGFFLEFFLCTQRALLGFGLPLGTGWAILEENDSFLPVWGNLKFCSLSPVCLLSFIFQSPQVAVACILSRILVAFRGERGRSLHGVLFIPIFTGTRTFCLVLILEYILKYTKYKLNSVLCK